MTLGARLWESGRCQMTGSHLKGRFQTEQGRRLGLNGVLQGYRVIILFVDLWVFVGCCKA